MDVHIEMEQKGTTCSYLLESTLYVKSKEKTNKKQQVTMDISMTQNSSRITIFFSYIVWSGQCKTYSASFLQSWKKWISLWGHFMCLSIAIDPQPAQWLRQLQYMHSPAVSLEAWGPQRNLSSTTAKEWGPCSLHLSKSHRIMMEQKSSTYKQLLHGCQHPLCTIFIVDLTNVFLLERIPDRSENFILSAWTEKREHDPSFKCTAVCTC